MATIHLKDMPIDVRKIILEKQMEIKLNKNVRHYSQQLTIYHILREWKDEKEKKKP